ncbi:MAG TPA: DUF2017 family protein [Acidimicrobiales bacterium]|nr:DUF2017 family protein [Acidimicrobiales bacterium]
MRLRRRRLVERKRKGRFVLNLDDDAVDLIADLAGQLDPLLDDPSADPGLRRLFPPAHTEDVLAEAAWQIEQGGRLRDARRVALAALDQPPGTVLNEDELVAWMQGVNALRLVLAERLQVTSDPEQEQAELEAALAAAESDDDAVAEAGRRALQAWAVYQHLGLMVSDAVDALGDPA